MNQCKIDYSPGLVDRCGFSAGLNDHLVTSNKDSVDSNEIDLSPLDFDCMGSGCELEYAQSAERFRNQLSKEGLNNSMEESVELLSKEEVKRIIASVFSDSLAIAETTRQADEAYIPYIDPSQQLGIEPIIEKQFSLNDYVSLANFWVQTIGEHQLLLNPIEFLGDQAIELECYLCGTPALNLAYGIRHSIDSAQKDLDLKLALDKQKHEMELATVRTNAMILAGAAKLTKSFGKSLIGLSESLSVISSKKVEAISKQIH